MEKKRTSGRKDPERTAHMTKRQSVYSGDSLNFNLKDYTLPLSRSRMVHMLRAFFLMAIPSW